MTFVCVINMMYTVICSVHTAVLLHMIPIRELSRIFEMSATYFKLNNYSYSKNCSHNNGTTKQMFVHPVVSGLALSAGIGVLSSAAEHVLTPSRGGAKC